jgi:hypothetical protein
MCSAAPVKPGYYYLVIPAGKEKKTDLNSSIDFVSTVELNNYKTATGKSESTTIISKHSPVEVNKTK